MVAAIDVMHAAGINYAHNMFIDCGDIDPRCFHMSYLTLSLLGAPAVVRLGDALAMKYHRAWFTPSYIFNWPHFRKELNGGKLDSYPTTPTKHASPDNKVEAKMENERTETITFGKQLSLF